MSSSLALEVELLEDAGIPVQTVYQKIVSKCIEMLQNVTMADQIPHSDLLCYLKTLVQYSSSSKVNIEIVCQLVIDKIIEPCLQIWLKPIETTLHQSQAKSLCMAAIHDLLLHFSTNRTTQNCVFAYISFLLETVHNGLCTLTQESTSDPQFIFLFVCHFIQKISIESLEKEGFDFSGIFEQALNLLKVSDAKVCFLIANSVLPLFITSLQCSRAERVWSFVEAVYLGKMNIEIAQLEFVLTILCCFRDVFVCHDKSSPFSSYFVNSVLSSPLVDLRVKGTFWHILQEGLVSTDPFSRKRCMYLLHCVLLSVHNTKSSDLYSENDVFWWAKESTKHLKSVWDDLILVLETMEEKQVRLSPYKSMSHLKLAMCILLHKV